MRAVGESLAAGRARERASPGVDAGMPMQVATVLETFAANIADKRTPIGVDTSVL